MIFGLILVVVLVACAVAVGVLHATAGVVSIIIACGSLAIAVANAYITIDRNRKKDTIAAWSDWSDKSFDRRMLIGRTFGAGEISEQQALSLMLGDPITDVNGRELAREQREAVSDAVTSVLNGLERFAMGAHYGLYDDRVVRELGHTILIRNFYRFLPYIQRRRDQNVKAYSAIETYVRRLEGTAADRWKWRLKRALLIGR